MDELPDRPEILLAQREWLQALARQLVSRRDLADELAHDTLAAAVSQPLPQRAGPRAWLAAILRRRLAGHTRAEARRRDREAAAARTEAQPSVSDTVARFEVQRDVANAVLSLAEPYRTTVLLRFWDDLSPGAIARRQGVPVETVRTRLKRGLQHLRDRLDREHGGNRAAWAAPLVSAAWPTGVVTSFLIGVLWMNTGLKVAAAGLAAAALALLFVEAPWSARSDALALEPRNSIAAVAAGAQTDAPTDAATELATAGRVTVGPDQTWLDVTGTVVDHATGAPIADCALRLAAGWPGREDDVVAATAADGSFRVRDARPRAGPLGNRSLVVRAPDRAPLRVRLSYERTVERPRADLGTIRLAVGTRFSGQVTAVDATPVPHAELWLAGSGPYGGGFEPEDMLDRATRVGTADAEGQFVLDERVAPDIGHCDLLFACAPQGIGWCAFVASNERRDVEGLAIRLRPEATLRVRVLTDLGTPVAGADVRALARFGPIGIGRRDIRAEASLEPSLRARFRGHTDADGWTLLHLPIGLPADLPQRASERSYDVWVVAPEHGEQPLVACEVKPDAEQEVIVRLTATRRVTIDVDARNDLGEPIAAAAVDVYGEGRATARTDEAGHAQVVVAAGALVLVSARAPGHRDASRDIQLETGDLQARVELTLTRTLPFEGRVVDQFGAPAARSIFVDDRMLAETDAAGAFRIEDFPLGTRRVVLSLPSGVEPLQWFGKQTPEAVDAAAGPVTFVVQRRPGDVAVRATVVDAANGQPLELASVALGWFDAATQHFWPARRTRHDLGVVVGDHLPVGRWRLDVRTVSGARGSREFTLTEGQPVCELRLELPKPGTIAGRLQFVDVVAPTTVTVSVRLARIDAPSFLQYPGVWAEGANQTVLDNQHGWTGRLQLQPALDRTFRLESVPPGEDLVFTVHGDGITGEATVRLQPDETRELAIDVRAAIK